MGNADREDAVREVTRVADRLDALGPSRLDRAGEDGSTPARRVRSLLQQLADVAADGEGRPRRDVPRVAGHALADQLRVLAHDALAVADDATRETIRARLATLRRTL